MLQEILETVVTVFSPHLWKQDEPEAHAPIKYDPQFGFDENPRPQRTITATKEEMDSCALEPRVRDFCAHYHIQWRNCVRSSSPFWYKCKGLKKELDHCYYEEKIHDMKEFEREKRLNARERKMQESGAA